MPHTYPVSQCSHTVSPSITGTTVTPDTTATTILPQSLPFSAESPWLAPLAGYSDLPFRLLCREFGAAVCCTEMVSAKGILYNNIGTQHILQTTPEDMPLVVQLFGSEVAPLQQGAQQLVDQGFTWFDLNMGCSVHKVVKTGAGSALCKTPELALEIAHALITTIGKGKIGFKIRLGWQQGQENALFIATELEKLGAGWVTLHPRYAKQGFSGIANWQAIAELKQHLGIPVIASGDLWTAHDALRCLQETHCDTIMFARGAMNNPYIFTELKELLQGNPIAEASKETLLTRLMHHYTLAKQYLDPHIALLKMRTIAPRYIRSVHGTKELRQQLSRCASEADFFSLLDSFCSATIK